MKTADGTEWVLVPRVATEEMRDAGYNEAEMLMYRSVITAAPQPPVEEMVEMIAELILKGVSNDDHEDVIASASSSG